MRASVFTALSAALALKRNATKSVTTAGLILQMRVATTPYPAIATATLSPGSPAAHTPMCHVTLEMHLLKLQQRYPHAPTLKSPEQRTRTWCRETRPISM